MFRGFWGHLPHRPQLFMVTTRRFGRCFICPGFHVPLGFSIPLLHTKGFIDSQSQELKKSQSKVMMWCDASKIENRWRWKYPHTKMGNRQELRNNTPLFEKMGAFHRQVTRQITQASHSRCVPRPEASHSYRSWSFNLAGSHVRIVRYPCMHRDLFYIYLLGLKHHQQYLKGRLRELWCKGLKEHLWHISGCL